MFKSQELKNGRPIQVFLAGRLLRFVLVDRELDSSDFLADHRKNLAPQSVVLLFGVVDSVGVGILPVVGDREGPSAVAQSKIASHVHRQQPRELQRGDASKSLMEHRDIHCPLIGIIGRT